MSVTPFRQVIRPGDTGMDVFALRRALRKRGHNLPALGYTAGPKFEVAIRDVQQTHHLTVDGLYGPQTHAIVAQSFDAYGVWLYVHAALRYVNPFAEATKLVAGRFDEGVDYHGVGPILALGDGHVVGLGGSGWPGGQYLLYRLSRGEHAGRYVYVAEAIVPHVVGGESIKAGQRIASFGRDAQQGFFPGIELGWSSPTLNLTYAIVTTGYHETPTPAGLAFARLLKQLGAPVSYDPGAGPTFPV